MNKVYNSFKDIELDLKRLSLERQIAKEELKAVRGELKQSVQPTQWMQTGIKLAGKFGSMVLLKKLFRR
ncbi:hypothetical protein [Lacinutrix sp. MedPE-SW]|uniref:hypothetical protein n=1 Tax=Lacinutrix sp. MedPE-SW TaxID=1860087 RepID=UPI00091BCF20|nr:hypothetical protein [Lacinutrix sp. MedPE-SW]OIQ23016.1 MAG: hypothetical protein BM549_05705 [Lacinutrix sp. MedPE-SW]